ncbi:GNAT family N-acetyltransferase [Legionella pneumophila serogroup 1]
MKTKIFTEINTPRLKIRPISLSDTELYFASEQASIKELEPHWSWVKEDKSVEDIKLFINEAIESNTRITPPEMYFAVFTKENKFLGTIWYFEINWFVPSFKIAYWLDTRSAGQGYMAEAVNALSRASFILYGANRVQIKIATYNQKSISLAKRLGFHLEGEMTNYFINFVSNKIYNGYLYACTTIEVLPDLDIEII